MILSMKKITCWNDLGQKKCSKCREFKDPNLFGKRKTSEDGYETRCKFCISEYYRNTKYPKKRDKNGFIICRSCNKYFDEKDMKFSGMNKNSKRLTYCKECFKVVISVSAVKKYGISAKQYYKLLHDQEYKCKICKSNNIDMYDPIDKKMINMFKKFAIKSINIAFFKRFNFFVNMRMTHYCALSKMN